MKMGTGMFRQAIRIVSGGTEPPGFIDETISHSHHLSKPQLEYLKTWLSGPGCPLGYECVPVVDLIEAADRMVLNRYFMTLEELHGINFFRK
jgi:hypothetical protein